MTASRRPTPPHPHGSPSAHEWDLPHALGMPRLTTTDAVGQAMAVGPVQAAGFQAFLVAGAAGGATPFAVVLATVAALSIAWAVSLYAERYAGAGTVYEYAVNRFGPLPGVALAVAYFLAGLVFTLGAASAAALLWQRFLAGHAGFDPGFWPTGLLLLALILGLVYVGVRLSVRTQLLLTALSAIPFLVLIVAVVAQGGQSGNTLAAFDPSSEPSADLLLGVLLAMPLFSGFEMAGALGEEARRPHTSIPRAMLLTTALAGAFFVATAYAGTLGFGPSEVAEEWGGNPVGLLTLGDRYVGPPLGALAELGVLVDLLAVGVAAVNAQARGVFALARDRLIPDRLAAVSRHRTPVGGIVVVAAFALTGMGIASVLDDAFDLFRAVAVTLTLVVTTVYLVLGLGAARFTRERGRSWSLLLFPAWALPAPLVLGVIGASRTGPQRIGVWLAVAVVIVTAASVTLLRARRVSALAMAGGRTLSGPDAGRVPRPMQ